MFSVVCCIESLRGTVFEASVDGAAACDLDLPQAVNAATRWRRRVVRHSTSGVGAAPDQIAVPKRCSAAGTAWRR
jgi:hypothetical protein